MAGLLATNQRPIASKPFPPGTYSQEELSRNEFQYIEDGLGLPSGVLQALMMAETQDFPDNRDTVESSAGAKGAFQLMPFLSKAYGVDPTNRHEAAMAAGQELQWQLRSHDGDLDKALASYNFGHGRFRTEAAGDLSRVPDETKKHRARFHEYYDEPKPIASNAEPPLSLGGLTGYMTTEGRPAYHNNFGGMSTEYSIGTKNPKINNGLLTHIPSIYDGQIVDQRTAEDIIIQNKGYDPETGRLITPGGDPEARSKNLELIKNTARKPFPPGTYSGNDANMTLIHPGPKNLIR